MRTTILGKTGISITKNGFGALPIQRDDTQTAVHILRKAYESGIDFFDTARLYTDSETKIGLALKDVRDKIVIATKTQSTTAEKFWDDLHTSLKELQTDYIDFYQFHNPSFVPRPGDESGIYDAALKAKEQGLIRFIGITNHNATVAKEAVESGLYELLQFPINYLSTPQELDLIRLCREREMPLVAMKAMSGGLLSSAKAPFAFLEQFENVVPIWGIQHEHELDEFLSYMANPPRMDEEIQALIEKDRKELASEFCRGCGYCAPCPVDIPIHTAARMSLMLRRAPVSEYTTPQWVEQMSRIDNCLNCRACVSRCPYGLDIPRMLKENYEDFKTFLK